MQKLIEAYLANPTFKNARKIRAYERAHAFIYCTLKEEHLKVMATAIAHANTPQESY
jgi:hypothetical protein